MPFIKEQLNIELPDKKVLQLLESRSGDLLIAVCIKQDDGQIVDLGMGVLPLNRRDLIANYIKP